MKLSRTISVLALASIAGSAEVPQPGPSLNMIQKLHKALADAVFVSAPPPNVALVMANPGIPVAAPPDISKAESAEDANKAVWNFSTRFFTIMDTPMYANALFSQKLGEKVSNIVRDFLTYAQLQPAVEDIVKKEKYDAAKKKLTRERLKEFEKLENRINDLKAKKEAAMRRGDEDKDNVLTAQLNVAMREKLAFGDTRKILEALQAIREYENLQPAIWQDSLRTLFQGSMVSAGKPFPVQLIPPPQEWDSDSGWLEVHVQNSHKDNSSTSNSSSTAVSASGAIGGLTFGGGFEKQNESLATASNDRDFHLSFEVKRVLVDRPWLEASMFGTGVWSWPKEWKKISYGSLKTNHPDQARASSNQNDPSPRLPLIITEVILARNVKMNSSSIRAQLKKDSSHFKANAHAGWGPFSFSASHETRSASEASSEDNEEEGISTTGTQIVAFVGQAVPETPLRFSPNPPPTKDK